MLGEVRAFGGRRGFRRSQPACDHIWAEGCNNRPAVVKGGVSVLRLNEQADKLCGGFQRGAVGADAVVFGT